LTSSWKDKGGRATSEKSISYCCLVAVVLLLRHFRLVCYGITTAMHRTEGEFGPHAGDLVLFRLFSPMPYEAFARMGPRNNQRPDLLSWSCNWINEKIPIALLLEQARSGRQDKYYEIFRVHDGYRSGHLTCVVS